MPQPCPAAGSPAANSPAACTPLALATGESRQRTEGAGEDGGRSVQHWLAVAASSAVPGPPAPAEAVAPAIGAATAAQEEVAHAAVAAAADAGVGSASPAATAPLTRPLVEEQGLAAEQGRAEEAAAKAAPLAPVAVVATAVAAEQDDDWREGDVTAGAASAGTPAVAEASDTRGCAQGENGTPAPANRGAALSARGKTVRLRARPAPRRLGATLTPGRPGPLLGWLQQTPSPQGKAPPSSSAPRPASGPNEGHDTNGARQAQHRTEASRQTQQAAAASTPATQQATHRETPSAGPSNVQTTDAAATAEATGTGVNAAAVQGVRRSARHGTITWGPPRGGRTPWMPVGRGGLGAPGNARGGGTATTGGGARGRRGGMRGGLGGGRGGRNPLGRTDIPLRSGPWRERHDRPESVAVDAQANEGQEGVDNTTADPDFMGEGEEAESEEISLDEEPVAGRNNQSRRRGETAAPTTQIPGEADEVGEAAKEDTDVPSPSDLAEMGGVWQIAGEWNVDALQRGDQPFLVRRLPPQLLDRYYQRRNQSQEAVGR
ncbi:unnamed protein product [Closterium sp. Naga37s-1]|nr:unnamed protein product [Closterium sp. Naga37s-1]